MVCFYHTCTVNHHVYGYFGYKENCSAYQSTKCAFSRSKNLKFWRRGALHPPTGESRRVPSGPPNAIYSVRASIRWPTALDHPPLPVFEQFEHWVTRGLIRWSYIWRQRDISRREISRWRQMTATALRKKEQVSQGKYFKQMYLLIYHLAVEPKLTYTDLQIANTRITVQLNIQLSQGNVATNVMVHVGGKFYSRFLYCSSRNTTVNESVHMSKVIIKLARFYGPRCRSVGRRRARRTAVSWDYNGFALHNPQRAIARWKRGELSTIMRTSSTVGVVFV